MKKINITCAHCKVENSFFLHELISGMPIKDDAGDIIEEYPEVEIDEHTLVACSSCGYPMSCANAAITDEDILH